MSALRQCWAGCKENARYLVQYGPVEDLIFLILET